MFDTEVTLLGRYKLVFTNNNVQAGLKVTYTMSTGHNTMLKKEDLSFSDTKLASLLAYVKKLDLEVKLDRKIHLERYKSK